MKKKFQLLVYGGGTRLSGRHIDTIAPPETTTLTTMVSCDSMSVGTDPLMYEDRGGGGDCIPSLPRCVCPKVMDMGPFWAPDE